MYTILYKKSVEKDLRQLPQKTRVTIIRKIINLATDPQPNGSVKLRGASHLYRVRQADNRIIYSVDGGGLVVLVIKIAHRKDVYRDI